MTFSLMTLSIERCYVECTDYFNAMLSVTKMNVVMLNVIMLSVVAPLSPALMYSKMEKNVLILSNLLTKCDSN